MSFKLINFIGQSKKIYKNIFLKQKKSIEHTHIQRKQKEQQLNNGNTESLFLLSWKSL